jgi:TPR repeat protein
VINQVSYTYQKRGVFYFNRTLPEAKGNQQSQDLSMYDDGEGVTQDYAEALKWFRKADEHGYAYADGRIADLKNELAKTGPFSLAMEGIKTGENDNQCANNCWQVRQIAE